jgi:hypothetical protein
MLYKFKSKAAGDVIMLGPSGDRVMRLLGREPAPRGIFEVAHMTALRERLEQAVAAEEQARRDAAAEGRDAPATSDSVSLRQRVWPLVDMLRRCEAAAEPITWGT